LLILPCLAALAAWPVFRAEEQSVQREVDKARSEILRMNDLLQDEFSRILSGSDAAPSRDLLELENDASAKRPGLGDTRVPLHLRLIERQRMAVVAAAQWAGSVSGHCDNPDLSPTGLLDTQLRARLKSVVQCHRRELDRWQIGIHRLNKSREATALKLKLPPPDQAELLSEARDHTRADDLNVEADFRGKRALLRSIDDLVKFMETHNARLADNQLLFDTAADGQAAQVLISRFVDAARAFP